MARARHCRGLFGGIVVFERLTDCIDQPLAVTEEVSAVLDNSGSSFLSLLLTFHWVSVWPPHLDVGTGPRRYLVGLIAPTKATHSTRLSAPIIRYFSASVRTAIRPWSPR